jgi:hypothetical protein
MAQTISTPVGPPGYLPGGLFQGDQGFSTGSTTSEKQKRIEI